MKEHLCKVLRKIRHFAPVLAFSVVASVSAESLYVAKDGVDESSCGVRRDTACLTIQYTITNRSVAGDRIYIGPGVYSELIRVGRNLTLRGSLRDRTIIDGMRSGTVVTIPDGVTASLERLTIRNGFLTSSFPANVVGGINNSGTLSLIESLVTGNSVTTTEVGNYTPLVGGVLNMGTLTISHSGIIANGSVAGCSAAGGLSNFGGTVTIEDSLLAENTVSAGPGGCIGPGNVPAPSGFSNGGSAVIHTTTFWKNGITTAGPLTFDRSTISYSDGYGIYNANSLTIVNSTIFGSASVGIIDAFGELNGFFNMSNTTVAGNAGGGVDFGVPIGSVIRNSILAGNVGMDCSGSFVSDDYNIIQNLTGCSFVGGGHDLTGVSPDLGKLKDNGGPTETLKPMHGSPAINGGNPAGCKDTAGNLLPTDQRGFLRPSPPGGRCDIGAVEVQRDRHHSF